MSPKLTAHVKAGGCASKLSPKILDRALANLPRVTNENVLIGYDTADDAGVYKLSDTLALVQTVDFFTPVVDDPFTFGAIAAANALSDVYAMGGRPILALALVAMPIAQLPVEVIGEVLRGGESVCRAAGIPIAGGHTIDSVEPIYGLVVLGLVHRRRSGAMPTPDPATGWCSASPWASA